MCNVTTGLVSYNDIKTFKQPLLHSDDVVVHEDKVADTASHDKQVEYFMGTKIGMLRIKNRKL